jgi:hypothetical protein
MLNPLHGAEGTNVQETQVLHGGQGSAQAAVDDGGNRPPVRARVASTFNCNYGRIFRAWNWLSDAHNPLYGPDVIDVECPCLACDDARSFVVLDESVHCARCGSVLFTIQPDGSWHLPAVHHPSLATNPDGDAGDADADATRMQHAVAMDVDPVLRNAAAADALLPERQRQE